MLTFSTLALSLLSLFSCKEEFEFWLFFPLSESIKGSRPFITLITIPLLNILSFATIESKRIFSSGSMLLLFMRPEFVLDLNIAISTNFLSLLSYSSLIIFLTFSSWAFVFSFSSSEKRLPSAGLLTIASFSLR